MNTNIFIATPSYKNTVSTQYLSSLVGYTNIPNLRFTFQILPNDSLVTRARNILFSQYQFRYQEAGYTHLFWQDDDIYVDGWNLQKLAQSGLDIVGIAYPAKTTDISRGVPCIVGGVYEEVSSMLYKAKYVGTGALLMSNKVVDAIVDYCIDNKLIYYNREIPNEIYNVFQTGIEDEQYLSEDWFLCKIINELGFDIYVDSSGECRHAQDNTTWTRPPMEIDKRAITQHFRDPLPENDMYRFWTPNDYKNPVPGTKI